MKYFKYVFLIIYICLISFIFYKSFETAEKSSASSNEVTDVIIDTIDKIKPGEESIKEKYPLEELRHFVRKLVGHYGLFLVLGIFSFLTYFHFFKRRKLSSVIGIIIGFVVASLSETIQIFADGRGPSFKDILIDYTGFLTSTILIALIYLIVYKIRNHKKKVVND